MGSGDMISNKMTKLMDAVRKNYALTDKLSLDQATRYIGEPNFSNLAGFNASFYSNQGNYVFTTHLERRCVA